MRILVAGATGAIGQRLVPQLVARGYQVAATTRSHGSNIWSGTRMSDTRGSYERAGKIVQDSVTRAGHDSI